MGRKLVITALRSSAVFSSISLALRSMALLSRAMLRHCSSVRKRFCGWAVAAAGSRRRTAAIRPRIWVYEGICLMVMPF